MRGRLDESGPTRACMANLIVFCSDAEELRRAEADAPAIVRRHPSRLLLLESGSDAGEAELEATVSAYCHLGGSGAKLCSEAVTLRANEAATPRLPAATRSLLIGDLPTALWWTASKRPPPHFGDLLHRLASMANQVIYDSRGWLDPVEGVIATANWAAQPGEEAAISDLAWRRLKPWRRLVAQTLDPALLPGALESIREVEIEHGPHALPKAWLLIGWLACRLGWTPQKGQVEPGVEVTWGFDAPSSPLRVTVRRRSQGEAEVERVAIRWGGAQAKHQETFARLGPDRIAVLHDDSQEPVRTLAAPMVERAALVARQLPNFGRDELFHRTLAISRTMARALQR